LAALLAAAWGAAAQAQTLKLDAAGGDGGASLPVVLNADRVRSVLDKQSQAEGHVSLTQGGLKLTADALDLDHSTQLVTARGQVELLKDGNRFTGNEAQVQMDSRSGYVVAPRFELSRYGASGQARRVDFQGDRSLSALDARYTSCRIDDDQAPDWLLSADRLDLDFEHNEGRAQGAVLHFLGVPILGAPVLSFPATDARKSGWLPPTIYPYDSRNGAEVEVPWYWNLAPNYDLTLTPGVLTQRGASLKTEFRYLFAADQGEMATHVLPTDRSAGRSRYSLRLEHEGRLDMGLQYSASVQGASDDGYWKDFSQVLPSLTPRLLAQNLGVSKQWALAGLNLESYARVRAWQVLQDTEVVLPPYQRLPQLGLRGGGAGAMGLNWAMEGEYNRFVLRDQVAGTDSRSNGSRLHLLGSVARPADLGWGWWTPRLAFNAAAYDLDQSMSDGRQRAVRTIPTLSLDAGLRYERDATLLGREVRQTLEPRVHYVRTPWRNQDAMPNFDSAAADFNELSIYGDNAFTGVDYVTDAHQVTLGATSRWFDPRSGTEWMRLGMAQRYLLRDQRITADRLTTTGLSAEPTTAASRFSDLLLFGSGTLVPHWRLDGTVQYNTDQSRVMRSVLSARWQPEAFHTIAASYRYARDLSEQFELGWQWPLYRQAKAGSVPGTCSGALYGVGRVNYSMFDSRITDAFAGVEYDAGCWISRVVVERQSTSRADATTRVMWQLELVGLSRLGPSPLKTLKDNIPGYQPLRSDRASDLTPNSP
jgi:LPS-assembly protein